MKAFDLLVAGEINPDLILTGDVVPEFGQVEKLLGGADLTVGSSSVIFACGAARLGLKTAFIGMCGDDVFGCFMLDQMRAHQVDVSHVIVAPGRATGVSVIFNRAADRAILTYPGLISELCGEHISDALLARARHLHVASYFIQTALQPGCCDLFRRAHALGLSTSLDTNYDPSERWEGFDDLLAQTDVFLPNEKEALSLARAVELGQAADILAKKTATLAIKLGAEGAYGVQGGQSVRVPAIPVTVVDTVGAGDSFDAGFIYGYLNGWPLEKSLRLGAACGGLSTRKPGGTAAQPTLQEALAYVN